jgi:hypothetical protein
MNTKHQRWMVSALGLLLFAALCGCLVADRGYDRGVGVGYVGGYYEPYGHDYGGWGHSYYVAPPRGGEHRAESSSTHSYRPAPPTRPVPSIPKKPRRPDSH